MACQSVTTTGTGASTAALTPLVDQVGEAYGEAYADAASKAADRCRQAGALTPPCKFYAYSGITEMVVTETGGPVAGNRAAKVDVTVRWQCFTQNPIGSATTTSIPALEVACGKRFTIEVTVKDYPDSGAALARATELADQQAQKRCDELPCNILKKEIGGAAGVPVKTGTKWQHSYTGRYSCQKDEPATPPR